MKLELADWIRLGLIVFLIILIFVIVKEAETIKVLAYDPCRICMNKTGAICFSPFSLP